MNVKSQALVARFSAPALAVLILSGPAAQAGVFDIPQFVTAGNFAVGIEPELTLNDGAGMAGNLKYNQGVTDLMNVEGIIGTGGGPRQFRVGANLKFDFIPDIESQPGIGIAAQALYVRVEPEGAMDTSGQTEVTAIPYIHKTFMMDKNEINPYLAIPVGLALSDGTYKVISTLAVGAMFKNSENFRYNLEVGFSINNADTYVSGGVIYYH